MPAPGLAQRALDRELNAALVQSQDRLVNDLTSMVVKKAPLAPVPAPAPETSGAAEKRKAEGGETETAAPIRWRVWKRALGHERQSDTFLAFFCIP